MKRIICLLIIMGLCAMTFVCLIIAFKNYDLQKGYILGKVKVVKEKIEKVIGTENNKTLTDEKLQIIEKSEKKDDERRFRQEEKDKIQIIEKSEKKDDERRFRQEEKDKINKNIATKRRVKSMKKQKKKNNNEENVVEQFVWRNVRKKQSRFYGKASISIGYGYSKKNNYADQIITIVRRPKPTNETSQSVSSEKNHFAFLSLGYNLYYRASDSFNPFIGFDIQGRIKNNNGKQSVQYDIEVDVRSASTDLIEYHLTTKNTITYKEYGRFAAKLGAKINIWKNIGIEPYALYGINVANINQYLNQVYSKIDQVIGETIIRENGGKKSTNNIGVVYGAGMNFLLGYRFIVGIEYYRSVNTMINQDIYDFNHMIKGSKTHIKMDNIIFKLGYQFG